MTANAIDDFIPRDIQNLYEVHNYRNAAQVLSTGCTAEFEELLEALRAFRLTIADIRKAGGNESDFPQRAAMLAGYEAVHGCSEAIASLDFVCKSVTAS